LVAKPEYFGFADVSQKIFAAKGQLVTQTSPNTYVADIAVGAGQGFGVVVSSALYALMATDQGTATPSISKQQMASLMTSGGTAWSILLPNNTTHPLSTTVTLARRSLSSGTQASAELFFLDNPCATGVVGGSATATPGTGAGQNLGEIIVKQEGSSDAVLAEMTATPYAIGVVSLENPEPANSWKYLAIDGVHPGAAGAPDWQRKNIINGKYAYAYETFMYKNTTNTLSAAILNNIGDFVNGIKGDLGVGANLANSNGLFGDPNALTADLGAETNHYSRGGNECATSLNLF
jgi:ABC-type phosphate transport system substrate-binding protein